MTAAMANVGPDEPPAGYEADGAPLRGQSRIPPHNIEAEESLLGSMLLSRSAIEIGKRRVVGADFYKPAHAAIYEAVLELFDHGRPVDPVTVAEELRKDGVLDRLGGRRALLRLQAATPASANASHYAEIIVELAAHRQLIFAAGEIAELGYDDSMPSVEAVEKAQELVGRADIPLGGTPDPNVLEFVAERHEYEWAIPDLLEVMDRLLLVAPEKFGKSTLIRQLAVCVSQGLDPFRFHDIPRCNVVLVDAENPAPLIRRKIKPMILNCENTLEVQFDADRLRICSRTGGLDLTQRSDELWLQERLVANMTIWRDHGWGDDPFILCIGPIYKLLEDELDLRQVRLLQNALERIRTRFRCTLVMETHAPHESFSAKSGPRSLRPAGPRVWLRWAEFCRAIEPADERSSPPGTAEFYDCQGARDERAWPWRLRRGGGLWPWRADEGV